jgi:RecG-like helicase
VAQLQHVSATVVPYQLTGGWFSNHRTPHDAPTTDELATAGAGPRAHRSQERAARRAAERQAALSSYDKVAFGDRAAATTPIGQVEWRQRVRIAGRVKSVRTQPRAGNANLECVLADGTGKILLVFQGRRQIAGIEPGARLVIEGMVGDWARQQAILNPSYEMVQPALDVTTQPE